MNLVHWLKTCSWATWFTNEIFFALVLFAGTCHQIVATCQLTVCIWTNHQNFNVFWSWAHEWFCLPSWLIVSTHVCQVRNLHENTTNLNSMRQHLSEKLKHNFQMSDCDFCPRTSRSFNCATLLVIFFCSLPEEATSSHGRHKLLFDKSVWLLIFLATRQTSQHQCHNWKWGLKTLLKMFSETHIKVLEWSLMVALLFHLWSLSTMHNWFSIHSSDQKRRSTAPFSSCFNELSISFMLLTCDLLACTFFIKIDDCVFHCNCTYGLALPLGPRRHCKTFLFPLFSPQMKCSHPQSKLHIPTHCPTVRKKWKHPCFATFGFLNEDCGHLDHLILTWGSATKNCTVRELPHDWEDLCPLHNNHVWTSAPTQSAVVSTTGRKSITAPF